MVIRAKRQLRVRKLYKENVPFRERAKFSNAENYRTNTSYKHTVKARSKEKSMVKYRDNLEHKETVKAKSKEKSMV